jgi:type II secretory pathway predicted ATPase ExeA
MGALIRIQHSIDSAKGLTVVIGDIGLGKTFLSRKILDRLHVEDSKYEAALLIIIHHEISSGWMLKKIALQLGVDSPADDKSTLVSQICRQLIGIDEAGKKAIILVDEAHMFQTKEIYEELRGLLNIESGNHKLLNIVLFGPPELEKFMELDPPLVSRVGIKITLKPLDEHSADGYILHRLKVSGTTKEIFTPEARKMVYKYSRGIPRLINALSDNALLEGFIQRKQNIGVEIIDQVAGDLGIKGKEQR